MTALDLCAPGRGRLGALTDMKLVQYSTSLVTIVLVLGLNLAAAINRLPLGRKR
jgi:hypothetical protein